VGRRPFAFEAPLRVGDAIERARPSLRSPHKTGRSGELVFVKVRHEIFCGGRRALHETHDIVYREAAARRRGAGGAAAAATGRHAIWQRTCRCPPDVLLFRYSALTFNGHRIHYDRRYVTEVEGYPGLVVHGPLIATLLLDLLRRESSRGRSSPATYSPVNPGHSATMRRSAQRASGRSRW
jgi:3-methylfumaryl-CoA hydratase